MTREEIHNEIGNVLKLIEINNNRMVLNDTEFDMDLELMKSHIIRLYGLHDQLSISETQEVEEAKPVKPAEPQVIKATPKPRPRTRTVVESKPEKRAEETKAEPMVNPEPTPPAPKPVVKIVEDPIPEPVKETTPEPVVEKPKAVEKPPVVIEKKLPKPPVKKVETKKTTSTTSGDLYERLKNSKLDSIKKGISISKRYELQNELFANDPEVYNETIKSLDSQDNLEMALDYFESTLMVHHQWEEEDPLVEELKTLILRRYTV